MNITLQETAPLQDIITIEVISEDYTDRVRKSITDIARKTNMPGFRPGKVPTGIVKKMYGPEVLREQLNKILQESLDSYIKENKISLLGYPLPIPIDVESFDPDRGESFTFTFEIGRQPEISLNMNIQGINQYQVEVDDDYLERELGMLRNRFGKMTNAEVAQAGDYLFGKIEETDNAGNLVEGGISHSFTLNPIIIDTLPSPNFPEGVKIGDSLNLDLNKIFKGNKKKAMLLNMSLSKFNIQGKGKQVKLTVEKINHYEPAELNEELFKKVFPGQDSPLTEQEFRAKLKESIQEFLNEEAKKFHILNVQSTFVSGHSFDLPETFLKKWLSQQEENKQTPEQIEASFPSWQHELRWSLLRSALLRQFDNLNVSEDEITQEARNKVINMFGGGTVDELQIESFVPYFLKNEESYNQIYESLLQEKLMAKINESLSVGSQKITATQFDQM